MGDGTEPIEDDELLYRRVPVKPPHFDPTNDPCPTPKAFRPRKDDTTGLSLSRAKYMSPEDVARTGHGKEYCVAVLRAGDLRQHGIDIDPAPLEDNKGHAVLPALTWENRKEAKQEEMQVLLAEKLCLRVEGPFPGSSQR